MHRFPLSDANYNYNRNSKYNPKHNFHLQHPLFPPLCFHFLKNVENSVESLWKTFVRRRCHGRHTRHTDHSLPQ